MTRGHGSQENIPMGILRRGSGHRTNRPVQQVHLDLGDLPSYNYNPDLHGNTHRSARRRKRSWAHQRSRDAQNTIQNLPSHNAGIHGTGDESALLDDFTETDGTDIPRRARRIVSEMGRDVEFMQDTPQAEQLRMETLREMPESLTMKRTIRREIGNTVHRKSRRSNIGCWKSMKYRLSISFSKMSQGVKNLTSGWEPWYQSLKVIEGHFGSGVATYFKYLRWLLLLNIAVCIASISFVVVPQLLYRFFEPVMDVKMAPVAITPIPDTTNGNQFVLQSDPYKSNAVFGFGDIFTGEGFFTMTTLYYGYYTNETVHVTAGQWYSMPYAYFFTPVASYIFMFIVLSISMAQSYRKSFIETAVGLKNVYAHKIFCGWDFSIATDEAAELKSKSIANQLKELLSDEATPTEERSWSERCRIVMTQIAINTLCVALVASAAFMTWSLLELRQTMLVSVVITIVLNLAPIVFSLLLKLEVYRSPRMGLYVTLFRTFLMEFIVVAMLVAYWLTEAKKTECWETSLAQEVYRLILMDFWIAIVATSLAEFLRYRLYLSVWPAVGAPEFDIARNTLNLIYNQTLFWAGGFFSPLLSFIVVVKMFVTFHLKRVGVLANCRPSERAWRAAQTQTVFLVLSFLSLIGVVAAYGYILTQVRPSDTCGPFRGNVFIYETILLNVLNLQKDNWFWKLLLYLTKPGVVAFLLIAMCVGVYYLRSRAHAHRELVELLREMVVVEAKDKEFLLAKISRVTEGKWMYNMKQGDTSILHHGSSEHLHGSSQHLHSSSQHLHDSNQHLHESHQRLHGSAQHLQGSPQHFHDSHQRLHGSAQHLQGSPQHFHDSQQRQHGSAQHLHDSHQRLHGSAQHLHDSHQRQHGSAQHLHDSHQRLHGSAQQLHDSHQRHHGSSHRQHRSTSAAGDLPGTSSQSTSSSIVWPTESDTSLPTQMSSDSSTAGFLARRMLQYPTSSGSGLSSGGSDLPLSNTSMDQILEQSDDDLNHYDGAKIRNMRKKHIKKY